MQSKIRALHVSPQAFNIYGVNLISNESGVSQRVYDEMGTPSDATSHPTGSASTSSP